MTAVANPKTFGELFQDATKDPFGTLATATKHAAYKKIYAHFNAAEEHGIVPEASATLTEITHLFEAEPIGGIAFFLQTEEGHRLRIAHGLRKYQPRASVSTSYARREFAYLGEARQGRCQLIQLAANMFNVTDSFRVLPPAGHAATLETDMAREYVPVLTDEDGVTENLRARQSCFVPFELMPFLLGKNLSPRQTFSLVYSWLEAQGLLDTCKPLADFVRVSNTRHATLTGDMPGTGLSAPGSLYQPEVDLELYMERMVLHRDLTGLNAPVTEHAPNHVVATLASAVEALKESHLQGSRDIARAPVTSVRDAFGESNTRRLLALCQVGDTDDLPPVY